MKDRASSYSYLDPDNPYIPGWYQKYLLIICLPARAFDQCLESIHLSKGIDDLRVNHPVMYRIHSICNFTIGIIFYQALLDWLLRWYEYFTR